MTWQQLVNWLTFEIKKDPKIANEPALVWLYDDVEYGAGEHEIGSIDPFNPYEETTARNRLSMNLKE
jgi:hypothetical protein